jgi:glycosyltransferase involved in cell wall biosynthesis
MVNGALPVEVALTPAAAELHDPSLVIAPGSSAPIDLTVFISCYNEEPYIIGTINTVRAALAELKHLSYELILIDDCSSDRSAQLVEEYIAQNPEERIIFRKNKVNQGFAHCCTDAAFIGRGKYFRTLCGDDSEPQDTIARVFGEIGQADIIVPYYATSEGRSAYRMALSKSFTFLVNTISGHKLHYYNGLAVHLRHNVMRWHSNTRGFGFQADLLCLLLDRGVGYKEVAVRTVERKGAGSTALSRKNILSVIHTLMHLMLRRISNYVYRKR